jgi:polysaccharide export outer membrane protein
MRSETVEAAFSRRFLPAGIPRRVLRVAMTRKLNNDILRVALAIVLMAWTLNPATALAVGGQLPSSKGRADTRQLGPSEQASSSDEAAIQLQIGSVYQGFLDSYRLGAGDVIAIHVDQHQDDSVERVVVSPVGMVYYPLLGNVKVAGKTMSQIQDYFTTSVSEYIREPRVTVSLLEANSSKIGVLGDVRTPGVIIMSRPMRLLDAITVAGGITDTGSSNVSILRQYQDGRTQVLTANVKHILKGKTGPEENLYLQAGDTIVVHGNLIKTIATVSSVVGIGTFLTFLARGH